MNNHKDTFILTATSYITIYYCYIIHTFRVNLSDEDKAAIQEGIDQLERGEYVSDEEVRKNLKGKFNFL